MSLIQSNSYNYIIEEEVFVFMMYEVKVVTKDNQNLYARIYANNQCDALMKIMHLFSPDGIHCPMNFTCSIKPIKIWLKIMHGVLPVPF